MSELQNWHRFSLRMLNRWANTPGKMQQRMRSPCRTIYYPMPGCIGHVDAPSDQRRRDAMCKRRSGRQATWVMYWRAHRDQYSRMMGKPLLAQEGWD